MNAASIPPAMSFGHPEEPNRPTGSSVSQLHQHILHRFQAILETRPSGLEAVGLRMASEVHRICEISDRIQRSGNIQTWQHSLAQHRIDKCLHYYRLGSTRGRVELHSSLSAIVYRYIAPAKSQLGFNGRYALLEDFLQNYYIEALNAFRREHDLARDYSPRSRLELAEYMAFCEQYAKRRINLRGRQSQQLLVLRAQAFARRLPAETAVDMALAADSSRSDEADTHARSAPIQQVRQQMVAEMDDPTDAVIRDRVVSALVAYLEAQDQQDCVDYLVLKLQDCSASEIDAILNLAPRERDYLQQRFKYHVEKFARVHEWELVHQWLEANLDQRFGMTEEEWQRFSARLTPAQQRLINLKREHQGVDLESAETAIANALGWTPKKVQRAWSQILGSAAKFRNQASRPSTKPTGTAGE